MERVVAKVAANKGYVLRDWEQNLSDFAKG